MSITGTVRELYIPLADYPHVRSDTTLRDVFAVLHASCSSAELFKSILVVDERDRLIGMLGLKNLLYALLPDYLRSTSRFQGAGDDLSALAALWQDDCAEAFHSAHKILVRDLVVMLMALQQAVPALKSIDRAALMLTSTLLFFIFGVLKVKDLEEMPWNIILLFSGAMSIGFCLRKTGAAQWMAVQWRAPSRTRTGGYSS